MFVVVHEQEISLLGVFDYRAKTGDAKVLPKIRPQRVEISVQVEILFLVGPTRSFVVGVVQVDVLWLRQRF